MPSTILGIASHLPEKTPRYYDTPMPIAIRRERPEDAAAVREINTAAFGRTDEAELVERLRKHIELYVALVATDGDQIVGHIVFTPVTLHRDQAPHTILALAPMAVRPAWQRRGVGSTLVREGLAACHATGHDVVVVVGHPAFYPRSASSEPAHSA
jgi:putative acetyltransferase